jgi:hypothetical protein
MLPVSSLTRGLPSSRSHDPPVSVFEGFMAEDEQVGQHPYSIVESLDAGGSVLQNQFLGRGRSEVVLRGKRGERLGVDTAAVPHAVSAVGRSCVRTADHAPEEGPISFGRALTAVGSRHHDRWGPRRVDDEIRFWHVCVDAPTTVISPAWLSAPASWVLYRERRGQGAKTSG